MIHSQYMEAIKRFEGFAARSHWDYAQHTNGFGTRAQFPGEVVDHAEAEKRFKSEIAAAHRIVENFAPDLDEGSKAALTSLTFNAGTAWTRNGLGEAIKSGDIAAARRIFLEYNKAGGETLAGLVARRSAEAEWFGQREGRNNPGAISTGTLATSVPTAHLLRDTTLSAGSDVNIPHAQQFSPGYRLTQIPYQATLATSPHLPSSQIDTTPREISTWEWTFDIGFKALLSLLSLSTARLDGHNDSPARLHSNHSDFLDSTSA
jgi:GH24 family phage-related lysozyme (muramidase)